MQLRVRVATLAAAAAGVVTIGVTALLADVPQASRAGEPASDSPAAASAQEPSRRTATSSVTSAPTRDTYVASPFDIDGQVKETAARFVERVGTWDEPFAADVDRVTSAGYPADLAATAAPLLDVTAPSATTSIIYPQYGGLTDSAASVVVLARQQLRTDDGDQTVREVTLDVRLRPMSDGVWQVTSVVDPPRPGLSERRAGGPTELGQAVLDDPRVRLSATGRADIVDRRVNDPILAVLADLARTWTLDVQVFVSGHPGTVFPTTRLSNHAVGRGVDIRAIDGRPVIGIPRDDAVITEFMVAAGRAGATEVGGPVAPDGSGFFSDDVHQDHFHLGITPTKPPAVAS